MVGVLGKLLCDAETAQQWQPTIKYGDGLKKRRGMLLVCDGLLSARE